MQTHRLVPELVVSDFEVSLHFYVSIMGFEVKYRRRDPNFAVLELEGAPLMIEEAREDSWIIGELVHPFGRGLNLQIECSDVADLRSKVAAAGLEVYQELHEAWYPVERVRYGQRQFLITDPDGYLLRFYQRIGEREVDADPVAAGDTAPGRG